MKLQLLFLMLAMVMAIVMGSPTGPESNNLRNKNEKAKPCEHAGEPPCPTPAPPANRNKVKENEKM